MTTHPTIGSLFSGIGGLDLACEAAFQARAVWQVEAADAPRAVLARHWPDTTQYSDVRDLDPATLPRVDVLCAGFPCQDLSVAGSRAGLDGERSGLYRYVLTFTDALQPSHVVIENVPGLLKYRDRLDADFAALGYGLRWQTLRASDVGAPHLRKRVFILATRGQSAPPFTLSPPPADPAARPPAGTWPTPTCGDAKASGSRSLAGSGAHSGTSLTDAVRPDRAKAGQTWPTPAARDYRSGVGVTDASYPNRKGTHCLPELLRGRLNPEWVEALMGLPVGWTLPDGEPLPYTAPRWPALRGCDQHEWEPARVMHGKPVRGRPARLRALGNAVVPAQAIEAITRMLED